MDDEIFVEIMKRINKKELSEDDFLYIENEREIREEVERFEQGVYEVARQDAWKDVREEVWEDGMEKGRKEGREEGIKQGEKRNAFEIAGRLKAKGFDDEIIAEVTGLSPEEIAQL